MTWGNIEMKWKKKRREHTVYLYTFYALTCSLYIPTYLLEYISRSGFYALVLVRMCVCVRVRSRTKTIRQQSQQSRSNTLGAGAPSVSCRSLSPRGRRKLIEPRANVPVYRIRIRLYVCVCTYIREHELTHTYAKTDTYDEFYRYARFISHFIWLLYKWERCWKY